MSEDWVNQMSKKVSMQVLKGLDIDPVVLAKQMTPIIKKQITEECKTIVARRVTCMIDSAVSDALRSNKVQDAMKRNVVIELLKSFK